MSRIVIVARTQMRVGHVCLGGHDLDQQFRPVRLLDRSGNHWSSQSPFEAGDLWSLRYRPKPSPRPRVEDVAVWQYHRLDRLPDLKGLVLKYIQPWVGAPEALFEATVTSTASGRGYSRWKGHSRRAAPATGCRPTIWCNSEAMRRCSLYRRAGAR